MWKLITVLLYTNRRLLVTKPQFYVQISEVNPVLGQHSFMRTARAQRSEVLTISIHHLALQKARVSPPVAFLEASKQTKPSPEKGDGSR
jgi:hypothetical protein